MKLTRSQIVYVAVLGIALGAFVIDQTLLAPREASGGGTPAATTATVTTAFRLPISSGPAAIPERRLASRLREYGEERGLDPMKVGDPFAVPAPWLPDQEAQPRPVGDLTSAERFASKHRLNAVMANAEGGYAIVDDKRLRLGEELDGFRLVAVRPRSILLSANDVEVELTLAD